MVLENHAGQFFLWQQMRKNNHTKSNLRHSRNLIKISRQKDPSLREKARDGFTNT